MIHWGQRLSRADEPKFYAYAPNRCTGIPRFGTPGNRDVSDYYYLHGGRGYAAAWGNFRTHQRRYGPANIRTDIATRLQNVTHIPDLAATSFWG